MPWTLTQLQYGVLSLLNESADSNVAELDSGGGASPTITTLDQVTYYLNEAASTLCRTCYVLSDKGTLNTVIGQFSVALNTLVTAGGGVIWAARQAAFGGTSLKHIKRAALELHYPTWDTDAPGAPLYWDEDGQQFISTYPRPSTVAALVVSGLSTPPPLIATGGSPVTNVNWLPDDLAHLLIKYAAAQVAQKNFEDDTLLGRAAQYWGEWNTHCMRLWERIDPPLRDAHYPTPPVPMQVQPGGSGGDGGE